MLTMQEIEATGFVTQARRERYAGRRTEAICAVAPSDLMSSFADVNASTNSKHQRKRYPATDPIGTVALRRGPRRLERNGMTMVSRGIYLSYGGCTTATSSSSR